MKNRFDDISEDVCKTYLDDFARLQKNTFIRKYLEEVDDAITGLRITIGNKTTATLDEIRFLQGTLKGFTLHRERYDKMANEISKSLGER